MGFINDGSFKFSPAVLAASAPALVDKGAIMIELADRNGDGGPDLLIVAGNYKDAQADNSIFVMLGDGKGKFKAPGPQTAGRTPLVPHGPDGSGIGLADVTGDGLADVLMQAAEGGEADPMLRVYASMNATTVAPAMELKALGFEFADVDEDGKTDIVTTVDGRLSALLSRAGTFQTRDLGVSIAMPHVKDFVVDPGVAGMTPATVHVLYDLEMCPACEAGCSGHCPCSAPASRVSPTVIAPGGDARRRHASHEASARQLAAAHSPLLQGGERMVAALLLSVRPLETLQHRKRTKAAPLVAGFQHQQVGLVGSEQ